MPDLSSISHFPLKVIFAIHLVLVTWGIQGHWCPRSAMFYNLLFFICLLWAVHSIESDEPLQFALFINVLSIFFDIVTLSVYFPIGLAYASEKFSAAFMIINLIVRVVTSIYLLRIGQARGGSLATMFTSCPPMGIARQDYEDISHSIPQNSDFVGI
ncbi:PREDICTED: type-1 angiotensin II receptor-associated protein [Polistes canadensis]|uniref:type-1 angiotensin II receptor-associated protein n=1 Tax=Polistes canadensis TaxID=91411 RepID=UPI000718D4ED|nr:PREDICTED: type-1 angiotensin II receptor-associated protein [Polistes canadensis]